MMQAGRDYIVKLARCLGLNRKPVDLRAPRPAAPMRREDLAKRRPDEPARRG